MSCSRTGRDCTALGNMIDYLCWALSADEDTCVEIVYKLSACLNEGGAYV